MVPPKLNRERRSSFFSATLLTASKSPDKSFPLGRAFSARGISDLFFEN